MADLITSARAKYNINQASFTTDENSTIAALITACSQAIVRHCKREFVSQQYDELYNGVNDRRLTLNRFPIISVARVAYSPTTVLRIINTSASNQRATVAVTSTGLSLTRVASGTSSTDTSVTWGTYATLGQVATAVSALGNGWSATVADGAYTNRASADLRAVQGALNALNVQAYLRMHVMELSDYEVDANHGWLVRGVASLEVQDAFNDPLLPTWFGGIDFWRVIYTAGFATVPEDVQEACAEWVAMLFWQTKRDPGVTSESIPGAVSHVLAQGIPEHLQALLAPYRDHKMRITGG
ncbi:MAG TPA: hypothetical protein VEL76_29640 [Gemmataceae bacterium]|nr:hypothetical protein [Gemmataceae bacterium]